MKENTSANNASRCQDKCDGKNSVISGLCRGCEGAGTTRTVNEQGKLFIKKMIEG